MDYGSLKRYLLRDVLPDLPLGEGVSESFRFAHLDVQRRHNWRAMDLRVDGVVYPARSETGVAVPVTGGRYKMARQVWLTLPGGLELVRPSEQAEIDRLLLDARRWGRPSLGGYEQRWLERETRLVLWPPPDRDLELVVDVSRYLPFYEDLPVGGAGQPPTVHEASDWFSENVPDVLVFGAAWHAARAAGRPDAVGYLQTYEKSLADAWFSDAESRQAGVAEAVRPPRVHALHGGVR